MVQSVLYLVMASAVIHAAWNAALRQVKGDFAVLYFGMVLGGVLAMLFATVHAVCTADYTEFIAVFSWGPPVFWCMVSAAIHDVYVCLLTTAYWYGDLSVIYPIARGSGVALTALLSQPFVGEKLPLQVNFGIFILTVGVFFVGIRIEYCQKSCEQKVLERSTLASVSATNLGCQSEGIEIGCHVAPCASEYNVVCHADDEVKPPCMNADGAVVRSTTSEVIETVSTSNSGMHIIWGISIGLSIAIYSVVDKLGVHALNATPVVYIGVMNIMMVIGLLPVLVLSEKHIEQTCIALQARKRYISVVGFGGTGCYIIVLFAMQSAPVSIVCALRESAVIWSCVLGVLVLNEPCSFQKGIGVFLIFVGMVVIELGA